MEVFLYVFCALHRKITEKCCYRYKKQDKGEYSFLLKMSTSPVHFNRQCRLKKPINKGFFEVLRKYIIQVLREVLAEIGKSTQKVLA